jgi:phosphatidylinositol dimannoside acyltransferase
MLRVGLEIADLLVRLMPSRAAYALADLAGDAWHRLSGSRRRLVAANLRRVCEATGRATSGSEFRGLVRAAFRNHARYYVEMLRGPHYRVDRIATIVDVPDWELFRAALDGGPSMFISWHLGNFEPFGTYLGAHGVRPMAPIEEIEPPELYRFLSARRGAGHVDLVPLRAARGPLSATLRAGGLVGIIGDRDLAGDGQRVIVFGHPTTMPAGPAMLAVLHRATVIAGRCLRTGPDRFHAAGELIEVPATGDRRADVAGLIGRLVERMERDIAEAPDQWWGAFQPYWPDLAERR